MSGKIDRSYISSFVTDLLFPYSSDSWPKQPGDYHHILPYLFLAIFNNVVAIKPIPMVSDWFTADTARFFKYSCA